MDTEYRKLKRWLEETKAESLESMAGFYHSSMQTAISQPKRTLANSLFKFLIPDTKTDKYTQIKNKHYNKSNSYRAC